MYSSDWPQIEICASTSQMLSIQTCPTQAAGLSHLISPLLKMRRAKLGV